MSHILLFNHNSRGVTSGVKLLKNQTQWEHNIFSTFLINCHGYMIWILRTVAVGTMHKNIVGIWDENFLTCSCVIGFDVGFFLFLLCIQNFVCLSRIIYLKGFMWPREIWGNTLSNSCCEIRNSEWPEKINGKNFYHKEEHWSKSSYRWFSHIRV